MLETSNSGETREGTVDFVSVKDTKVSISQGKISVRSLNRIEHKTVSRTVHRLESVFFIIILEKEHIFFILVPMTRDFPKLGIEEVRSNNLRVSSNFVLFT